jgi:hypothetical protein
MRELDVHTLCRGGFETIAVQISQDGGGETRQNLVKDCENAAEGKQVGWDAVPFKRRSIPG